MMTRLPTIVRRFGFSARKSERHINLMLATLEAHNARATIPVTAVTARRHPELIRGLLERNVEIAAHGYVHNDWASLSYDEQVHQARLAREELFSLGLPVRGWRCPYSRLNEHTLSALRINHFEYDATPVCSWPSVDEENIPISSNARADYQRFCRLITARDSRAHVVLPTIVEGLVQIPMSIPQDEDMVDRLHLNGETMGRVWLRLLRDTHDRQEAFVMCMHPERAGIFCGALDVVLREARKHGDVWIATLGEICDWWRERDGARVHVSDEGDGRWRVTADGPAQLLVRYGDQTMNPSCSMTFYSSHPPHVTYGPQWLPSTIQRLRDAGFVAALRAEGDPKGAIHLDDVAAPEMPADLVIREVLTERAECLMRIAPWPVGFTSCLSVTADIDAITLFDFMLRIGEF